MVPLDHVLALALLIAPAECEEAFRAPEHASVWRSVRAAALSLELLDPRELPYLLARSGDYEADLRLLRRRFAELRDAPPLADVSRFPHAELACCVLAHNRAFHRDLSVRRDALGATRPEFDAALHEAERLYKVWDAARDARGDYYYVIVRRQALARLRELLGEDAYHRGQMPPPTPPGLPD